MICNNCGTENLDDMLYCKKCGAKTKLYYKINQKNSNANAFLTTF